MAEREWPVNRARAWLLRKAAEMVGGGSDGANVSELLIEAADADSALLADENGFRHLLLWSVSTDRSAIDRAVAEVYGEARACDGCEFVYGAGHVEALCKHQGTAPLRPADEVANEMVNVANFHGTRGFVVSIDDEVSGLDLDTRSAVDETELDCLAEDARRFLTRVIKSSRAEGAAVAQARIAELEAALRDSHAALHEVKSAHSFDDAIHRAHEALHRVMSR